MKITRIRLVEMIAEEIRAAILEFSEKKKGSKSSPGKPSTASADNEPTRKQAAAPTGPKAADRAPDDPTNRDELGGSDMDAGVGDPAPDGDGAELDATADADPTAAEDEMDAVDPEGDAGEEPSGEINDDLSGKTMQAISIEPKSKVLPGSKEVILTFNETTDTLRILITGTGQVKFFWRNQLKDMP